MIEIDSNDKKFDGHSICPLAVGRLDPYLLRRGYKGAYISDMEYKMVFRIDDNDVYVVGLFHDLEDYVPKVME